MTVSRCCPMESGSTRPGATTASAVPPWRNRHTGPTANPETAPTPVSRILFLPCGYPRCRARPNHILRPSGSRLPLEASGQAEGTGLVDAPAPRRESQQRPRCRGRCWPLPGDERLRAQVLDDGVLGALDRRGLRLGCRVIPADHLREDFVEHRGDVVGQGVRFRDALALG